MYLFTTPGKLCLCRPTQTVETKLQKTIKILLKHYNTFVCVLCTIVPTLIIIIITHSCFLKYIVQGYFNFNVT